MGGVTAYLLMAALIPAADAIAILRAAGVNAQKSPAPRGRCRTLCYLVAGQYVNLGRLRQLAREAMAAAETAPEAPAAPKAPHPLTVRAIVRNAVDAHADAFPTHGRNLAFNAARDAVDAAIANGADADGMRAAAMAAVAAIAADAIAREAGRAYETACLARYADPSDPEALYVSAMEGRRAVRAARIAATLAHANGADVAGVRAAAADAVAQLAALDGIAIAR